MNGIVACSWDVAKRYNSRSNLGPNIPVYNYCTAPENALTWGDFTTKTTKYGLLYPTQKSIWYLCYTNNPNRIVHLLYILFLHYLPAVMIDAFAMVIGKKPRYVFQRAVSFVCDLMFALHSSSPFSLLKTYKKIHRFMDVIEYFSMRQWEFPMDNMNNLWAALTPRDQELFNFDISKLDWDVFLHHYYLGIRQYLLKDPMETIPAATARYKRLYWLHQTVKVVAFLLIVRMVTWFVGLFM